MSNRAFAEEKAPANGHSLRLFRIKCRCGASDTFAPQGKPPIAAEQHFRRNGWTIGATQNKDRCPSCSSRKPRIVSSFADIPQMEPAAMPAPEIKLVRAEEPSVPTREERRVIFAKLEDVYEGEATGYSKGWSDHRVATDLGVPRAWVELIRSENFGDAQDNSDVRQFMAMLDTMRDECAQVQRKAAEAFKQAEATKAQAERAVAAGEAMAIRLREIARVASSLKPLVR